MSNLLKNLLFALGLAVILWLGYSLFLKGDETLLETSNSRIVGQATLETQAFLVRLQQLKSIDLDGGIFDDSIFKSLTDHRQALGNEPTGRENPFLPVE